MKQRTTWRRCESKNCDEARISHYEKIFYLFTFNIILTYSHSTLVVNFYAYWFLRHRFVHAFNFCDQKLTSKNANLKICCIKFWSSLRTLLYLVARVLSWQLIWHPSLFSKQYPFVQDTCRKLIKVKSNVPFGERIPLSKPLNAMTNIKHD